MLPTDNKKEKILIIQPINKYLKAVNDMFSYI